MFQMLLSLPLSSSSSPLSPLSLSFYYRTGDLEEMGAKGSLHEYLYHLHDKGHCPVTSFWWGKEHVVSVCSPQAFKDTIKLTDRPGEGERKWREGRRVVPLPWNKLMCYSLMTCGLAVF